MQNKGLLISLVILVVVGAAGFLVYQTRSRVVPTPTSTINPSPLPPANPPASPEEAKEIDVSGNEYSFNPKSIDLVAGQAVKLKFTNTGNLPHNLTIDELGVQTKTIGTGAEDVIVFTPSKSGTFTFYCSVGNHRQLGMEGSVTVK